MKRTKVKPEPKPITAQPPDGVTSFDTLVHIPDKDGGHLSRTLSTPGCYRTPKRPTDK